LFNLYLLQLQVQELLIANGMSLKDYIYLSMPNVSHSLIFQNRFIINELNYNKETMTQVHASLLQLLTDDQLHIVV